MDFEIKKVTGDLEEIIPKIFNPSFNKIQICLISPIIRLKPLPNSEEFIEVRAQSIVISN